MKYLIIILFLFSCQEEDFRISEDCYKLNNPEIYLDHPKHNSKTWAIDKEGNQEVIGCSLYEAKKYILEYNCNNYPLRFKDKYILLRWNGTKCSDV